MTHRLAQWASLVGISRKTIRERLSQAQQGKMRQAQQTQIVFHKGQIRVEGLSLNKEQKGTKSNSMGRYCMGKEEDKA